MSASNIKIQINDTIGVKNFIDSLGEEGSIEFRKSLLNAYANSHLKCLADTEIEVKLGDVMKRVKAEFELKAEELFYEVSNRNSCYESIKLKPKLIEKIHNMVESSISSQFAEEREKIYDHIDESIKKTNIRINEYLDEKIGKMVDKDIDKRIQEAISSKLNILLQNLSKER
jgi:hypothetical protein